MERNWQLGPMFAGYMDEKFEYHESWTEKYQRRTWEINWPKKVIFEWPNELLGWMDFEIDHMYEVCQIH